MQAAEPLDRLVDRPGQRVVVAGVGDDTEHAAAVVAPLYGGRSQSCPRNSTVSAWVSVITIVERRVTQRWTGASSHQFGSSVSRIRP